MSSSPRGHAAVAATCAALLGLLAPTAAAGSADRTTFHAQRPTAATAAATRVLDVGGGGRVAVTTRGDEPAELTVLPGRDGAAPGLVTVRTDTGTTVQTTTRGSVPTLVQGTRPPRAAAAADAVRLDLRVVGRDGKPAEGLVTVFDLEDGTTWTRQLYPYDGAGLRRRCSAAAYAQTSCALVPPGAYSVMALVSTQPAQRPSIGEGRTVQNVALVGSPETTVAGHRTVTFDARDARRMTVRTPGRRTKVPAEGMLAIGYDRVAADGSAVHLDLQPSVLLDQHFYLQPTAAVTVGSFRTHTRLRLAAPDIELSAPGVRPLHPEYVDSVWYADFDSEFPLVDGELSLRVVDVGTARRVDLAGVDLEGALALVTRSDALPVAVQSNRAAARGAAVVAVRNDVPGDVADPGGTGVRLRVPTIRLSRGEGLALGRVPATTTVRVAGEPASPYVYDLYLKEEGRVPEDLSYVLTDDQLTAQSHELHGQPTHASTYAEAAYPFQPGDTFSVSRNLPFRGDARARVEYRLRDPETSWRYGVTTPEPAQNVMFPQPEVLRMNLFDGSFHVYDGPQAEPVRFGAAPVVPGPNEDQPVRRDGDLLQVALEAFVDQDGHHGLGYSEGGYATRFELRADGALLGETDFAPIGTAELPAGESTVEVHFTTTNDQAWAELSTRTDSTWTFPSTTPAGGGSRVEPLLVPDYAVPVDLRNRVRPEPGQPVTFGLRVAQQTGAEPAEVTSLQLDASYDDGETWLPATLAAQGDGWQVTLPPGTGLVSLRLRAGDAGGSTLDQTVVRGFAVLPADG